MFIFSVNVTFVPIFLLQISPFGSERKLNYKKTTNNLQESL